MPHRSGVKSVDVSVLIPSFEYGRFIEDALQSALHQHGVTVEVIVQDGGSSDATVAILKDYGSVVDWRSELDAGQSDALNRALCRARGRWIGWLNADEFYLEGALAHLCIAGDASDADVAFADVVLVDEAGAIVRLLPQHRLEPQVLRAYGPTIANCGAIFRREALGQNPWDRSLKLTMDWDLYLTLEVAGATFAYTPFPAAAFRLHSLQATNVAQARLVEEEQVIARRHGVHRSRLHRARGKIRHQLLKVAAGGYLRQARARGLRAENIRWFHGEAERQTLARLRRCYARSAMPLSDGPEGGAR